MEINIKTLFKNSSILIISNASFKIISFLLLPIYTKVLHPDAYGIADTIINASALVMAVLSLSLDWGMNTYFYEETSDVYYKKITSSAMAFFVIGSFVCLMCSAFSKPISIVLFKESSYSFAVSLGFALASVKLFYFSQRVSTRMRGRLNMVGIFSFVELSITLVLNIVFVLFFHLGYIAIILSNLIGQIVVMILYSIDTWKYISIKFVDWVLIRKMLIYSIPIMPTLLFNWINAFLDRYFVGYFHSQTEVGLYGIGNRIVGCLSILTSSFLSAYASFAYSNAKKNENRKKYSQVLDYLIVGLTFLAIIITLLSKEVVQIMTAESYHNAYIVVGILLFAHIIHTIGVVVGYGITIAKKGALYVRISAIGAVVNTILNFELVPQYSFWGAAAATLITELVVFLITYYYSQRLFPCDYSLKQILGCIIISLVVSQWFVDAQIFLKMIIGTIEIIFIVILFRPSLVEIKKIITKRKRGKRLHE